MANPVDAVIVGNALNSLGFVSMNWNPTGLSLNTFGFLTPCDALWGNAEAAISTTWLDCPGYSDTVEDCAD